MKKVLASALIALAASVLIVTPAGAAVPSTKPKSTYACPGEAGHARVWVKTSKGNTTKFAVDNPCSQYLSFSFGTYANGSSRDRLLVAPGTHFNWSQKRIAWAREQGATVGLGQVGWEADAGCDAPTTVVIVRRYDDVRYAVDENGENC